MNENRGIAKRLLSFLFPARCAICGAVTGADPVCRECGGGLMPIAGEVCRVCGRETRWCTCAGREYEFARCVAPFYYESAAKKGVLRLKFAKKAGVAGLFADYAAKTVRREYADISFDVITAVPLSRGEYSRRGFNQSAEFARALAKRLRMPYRETLAKPSEITPQRSCGAAERWGNVAGAFRATGKVDNKTILLVDDIATTGATLNECAKVLKERGAAAVYCVVITCVRKTGGQRVLPQSGLTEAANH